MSRASGELQRPPWPRLLGVPLAVFLVVVVAIRVSHLEPVGSESQERNPFASHEPYGARGAAVLAAAGASAEDKPLLDRLASVPTAVWLTPQAQATNAVGDFVRAISRAAAKAQRVPVFVVYGIPDRDCSGGESSGGLPDGDYLYWVRAIGNAAGSGAAIVLEPDALATAQECGKVEQRVDLLRAAVTELRAAGPTTYVDAGHASWIAPADMAALLQRVGVDRVRGFATNVSGYESDEAETAYAEAVSAALGGAHYVTDTGRNGAGSNGEWCNPSGRALGAVPRGEADGGARDASLWIKPPGESDGTCNGGPAAGEFWPERALELAHDAGW